MMELPARALLFAVTAFVVAAVYLGFAFIVFLRQSRRTIGRVFVAFALLVGNHYLTSLFLFPSSAVPEPTALLLLRWKWAAASFLPALFLHLAWFYFMPSWKNAWARLLPVVYAVGLVLAGVALRTDLVVAGILYRGPSSILGPDPGPLLLLLGAILAFAFLTGIAGMFLNYRRTRLRVLRQQIRYLLTPAVLTAGVIAINLLFILNRAREDAPHELGHAAVLLMAFFYGRAILGYGSIVDRPVRRWRVFYIAFFAVTGIITLAGGFAVDRSLSPYTPVAFPFVTSLLLVLLVAGFPFLRPRLVSLLDRWGIDAKGEQQEMVQQIAHNLAEVPEPEKLQEELLVTLCDLLQVSGGFMASTDGEGTAMVQHVWGQVAAAPGDRLSLPAVNFRRPRLVPALFPAQEQETGWHDVTVLCPLGGDSGERGILALGEKKNGGPFTPAELDLCLELAERMAAVEQMIAVRRQQEQLLALAHTVGHTLHDLHRQATAAPLATEEKETPLSIRALGPLKIVRKGERVAEGEWRTEKAKGLLAYLLWKGREGATREELCAALWPDRSLEEAANTFHVTLHRLRRVLEPERTRGSRYIRYHLGRYRFAFDTPHELDVTRFRRLAATDEVAELKQAVVLYRGEYLQGLYWALPAEVEIERRHLENLYAQALRRLGEQCRGRERERYLEQLLSVVPADEAANRALVLAYLREGRLDLARRRLARWQQCLEELGLESPDTLQTLRQTATVQ